VTQAIVFDGYVSGQKMGRMKCDDTMVWDDTKWCKRCRRVWDSVNKCMRGWLG
jgi:hypothetical protein